MNSGYRKWETKFLILREVKDHKNKALYFGFKNRFTNLAFKACAPNVFTLFCKLGPQRAKVTNIREQLISLAQQNLLILYARKSMLEKIFVFKKALRNRNTNE